jgi:hyperosmotically inducible protein
MKSKQWISAAVIGLSAASFGASALAADHHPSRDKQSVGEYTSDAMITTKVKAALVAEKNLSALHVTAETNLGVVTLTGTVATAEQVEHAARVARGVEGVKQVENKLRVDHTKAK